MEWVHPDPIEDDKADVTVDGSTFANVTNATEGSVRLRKRILSVEQKKCKAMK